MEHNGGSQSVLHITPIASVSDPRYQLIEFLTEQSGSLLNSVRFYVRRMELARGEAVQAAALDVMQEVVVEALGHVERFDTGRQPMAWLLGIAMNVIKRKKAEGAKRYQRELSIARFSRTSGEPLSESDLFDQISPTMSAGPEEGVAADEQAALILALVSPDDRQVLRLAFLYEFDREELARRLGITPVAARVRLHRALGRLRSAWHQQHTHQQKGESI
ncbi:MAG: sigma-70 family RNA polymerase sigma factor [Ktedonobacteraceae bacterium]